MFENEVFGKDGYFGRRMMERLRLPEQRRRLMSVISIAFLFMRDDLKYRLGMR